jgi:hypothetical protein
VEIVRHLQRSSAAVVIVRLSNRLQLAVPEWMLSLEACDRLTEEEQPRVALAAPPLTSGNVLQVHDAMSQSVVFRERSKEVVEIFCDIERRLGSRCGTRARHSHL